MKSILPIETWSLLRGLIIENFKFSVIKEISGSAGLDSSSLSHLTQRRRGGPTKANLMDGLDSKFQEMEEGKRQSFIIYIITEIMQRRPDLEARIEKLLNRIGWEFVQGEPYPIELTINLEISGIDSDSKSLIKNALKRYRDGDLSGAVTSLCGLIDKRTEKIYSDNNMQNHNTAAFHEKIGVSIQTFENTYKEKLRKTFSDETEINRLWENHKKSVSQAGYVFGFFRRKFSDVHGNTRVPTEIIQDVIDKVVYILQCLR